MIKELEIVVLERDLPEKGLKAVDVGAVVHVYPGGEILEVEFVTGGGRNSCVSDPVGVGCSADWI